MFKGNRVYRHIKSHPTKTLANHQKVAKIQYSEKILRRHL